MALLGILSRNDDMKGRRHCSLFTRVGDYKQDGAGSTDQAALASFKLVSLAMMPFFSVHAITMQSPRTRIVFSLRYLEAAKGFYCIRSHKPHPSICLCMYLVHDYAYPLTLRHSACT